MAGNHKKDKSSEARFTAIRLKDVSRDRVCGACGGFQK